MFFFSKIPSGTTRVCIDFEKLKSDKYFVVKLNDNITSSYICDFFNLSYWFKKIIETFTRGTIGFLSVDRIKKLYVIKNIKKFKITILNN